ncbi:Rmf/CrpP fold protein [Actinomadura nitritigenes]|uniref:Rmf/CrpP fold protein n=1 Tax=Actinomadura nitritigenes TaxID=134602 RepID=UPI003D8AE977
MREPGDLAAALVMLRAHVAGQRAALAGDPATVCPYDPYGDNAVTRARARMWIRGYDLVRPASIDYTG